MTTTAATKLVTFRLGEDLFAADIYSVERVLRYQPPTPIPNVPEWIEGVLDYQQRVVPVISLRRRFELPALAGGNDTRILVFNCDGDWIAGAVDQVLDVAALDPSKVSPPPKMFRGLAAEYLRGIVRRDTRLVLYLDVAHLLSSSERLVLEKAVEDRLVVERSAGEPND
ncbi:MAG TPA: chemotaxis protein CheW [Gemmatimonadaceae bacterium]|nr:chemotaxis protein CheW [Gemmatimonadaceae bacterium]